MAILMVSAGKALPKKKWVNDDFDQALKTSDDWIRSHTGIASRYIANEAETSAELGAIACKEAILQFQNNQLFDFDVSNINAIVCATATPQFQGFPANACVIQEKIGTQNAACFDVSAACTGFIYALDVAVSLMERHHWEYALVCGTEVLSRVLDWNDRSTCVLFGDGAGAVLLQNKSSSISTGLGAFELGGDGRGATELYINDNKHIVMNGRAVYNFAVGILTDIVKNLLVKESLNIDDIDFIVCHQANKRILEAAAKRLGVGSEKFVYNMEEYGNTSAASIPIALADLMATKTLTAGMKIIVAGFGAGLTWGGGVISF